MQKLELPLITVISSMVCTRSITDAVEEIAQEHGKIFILQIFFINDLNSGKVNYREFQELVYATDIMLIDIRGNNPAVEDLVKIYHEMQNNDSEMFKQKTIISLVGGNAELRELTKMGTFEAKKIPTQKSEALNFEEIPDITNLVKKGIRISQNMHKIGKILPFGMMRHLRNWTMAMDYWVYGYSGIPENHKNLFLFLMKEYLGYKSIKVPAPLKIPQTGIFEPITNQYYSKLGEFLKAHPLDPSKQTIGIFYYGGIYFEQTLPILMEFMKNFHMFNVIPVYSEVLQNLEALQGFFFEAGRPLVGCVINLQYFQLNGGPFGGNNQPTLDLYRQLNCPQINPVINFDMYYEDYMASKQGILPINQVIAVIMPEVDGRIEMMNVGCMDSLGYSEAISSNVYDIIPLEDNIKFICTRVQKWMNLRQKANKEKKIALIIYDYPPGESTLGSASYLDVFASLHSLLENLKAEGYQLSDFPDTSTDLLEIFLNSNIINKAEHISLQNYKGIRISKEQYDRLTETLPETLRSEIHALWGDFPGKIMSDQGQILLPILQFGNVYVGLQPPRSQITDLPQNYHNVDLLPHPQYLAFYRYLEQIVQVDAIVHVGTHGTLEFLPGKENIGFWTDYNLYLIGSMPHLYIYHISNTSEAAIAKRRSNAVLINHASPPLKLSGIYEDYLRLETVLNEYAQFIHQGNSEDPEITEKLHQEIQDLAEKCKIPYDPNLIEEIELHLTRLKNAVIPDGLHTFGGSLTSSQAVDLIIDIILHSNAIPTGLFKLSNEPQPNKETNITHLRSLINAILNDLENDSHLVFDSKNDSSNELLTTFHDTEKEEIIQWITELAKRITNSLERKNLIRGLEGGYIEPGLGGDPIRTPEIFPTGRNSYGFDPRLIPSSMASKRGSAISEQLLGQYHSEHGAFPETVSVVLWAFETMKTGGETIGQIFNYLGVRAAKHKSVWTTELEIIPLEEMTHPRINVVVTICGIFRDTFPYVLDLINQAIERVAQLDEPLEKNFIKKNQQELDQKAISLPLARIFGPAPGKYNTNLTDIIGSGKWEDEQELAEDYIQSMGYAYLRNQGIKAADKTFQENLARIEYLSQVRDGVEYHITDLDHYYEFSGGLVKANEAITGKHMPLYIADTASREISVNSLETSIQEGIVTRNLNPQWINGMLRHQHHGTQKVAERVENLLGFSATTHRVDNWIWEKTYERYIEDETIKQKLAENNRFAMMKMIKTLLEANQRGYWTTEDEHIETLKREYLELDSWVERSYQ